MAKKKSKQEPDEIPIDEPDDARILSPLDDQMLTEEEETYWRAARSISGEGEKLEDADDDTEGS